MNKQNPMAKKKKKEAGIVKKIAFTLLAFVALVIGIKAYDLYKEIKSPNVQLSGRDSDFIYIPTGSGYNDVVNILYQNKIIIDKTSFEWVAKKKNYTQNVKPGRYRLKEGMSNETLVNMLRSGKQEPVKLVFNKVRIKEKFAEVIGNQIEATPNQLMTLLNSNLFLAKYGLNRETALCMFIPNTYEFYWNTSAEEFMERMYKEYKKFWTEERKAKAKAIGKTPEEVIILASIVEEETNINDDKAKIARVYLNRMKKGMRLQACPTIKYAMGDFELQRILIKHLEFEHPYNTYLHDGLPPGPICIPMVSSIDAVLKNDKNNYLYFCAKDDFSGHHAFASTLEQHNQNAEKYQRALNRNRIYH